jgi:hypothetical protein
MRARLQSPNDDGTEQRTFPFRAVIGGRESILITSDLDQPGRVTHADAFKLR